MNPYQVVLDTNVLVAALRSRRGASHKLLMLLGQGLYEPHLSVPLVLEYEDVLRRLDDRLNLSDEDIAAVLDYLCAVGHHQPIFYLWRPFLKDPKDDMVLELAVAAQCPIIITFNARDFRGSDQFGVQTLRPQEFLAMLGAEHEHN
jgi:putative PIN family toxin of toxin-antitoxin system